MNKWQWLAEWQFASFLHQQFSAILWNGRASAPLEGLRATPAAPTLSPTQLAADLVPHLLTQQGCLRPVTRPLDPNSLLTTYHHSQKPENIQKSTDLEPSLSFHKGKSQSPGRWNLTWMWSGEGAKVPLRVLRGSSDLKTGGIIYILFSTDNGTIIFSNSTSLP